MGLRRGAAAARGVQRAAEIGGAAVRRVAALCGIALGRSMRLRWSAVCGSAGAVRGTLQERRAGLRRGAACGCTDALRETSLGRSVGWCKGAA